MSHVRCEEDDKKKMQSTNKDEQTIEYLVQFVTNAIHTRFEGHVSTTNIMTVVRFAVCLLDAKSLRITPEEKRQVLLTTLSTIVGSIADETNPDEKIERLALERILETILPTVVDLILGKRPSIMKRIRHMLTTCVS